MGGRSFYHTIESTDARTAFNTLVFEATSEYGNDSYNGTISTCSYAGVTKLSDKYTKSMDNKAYKYAEERDFGYKRSAYALNLGIVRYEIREVKKEKIEKSTPKFEEKFIVKDVYGNVLGKFSDKSKAEELSITKSLETGNDTYITKEKVLVSGTTKIAHYTTSVRTTKTKPSFKESDKKKVYPIYKFAFYGVAAE